MTVTATFAVELKDETSGAANAAASSLVRLKSKIDDDVKALRDMQAALRNLKGGTATSAKAFNELKDRIAAQKAAIAASQSRYLQLGGSFQKVEEKAMGFAEKFGQVTSAMQASGGVVGALGAGLAGLAPLLANPVVIVGALVAAFVGLSLVVGSATVAMLRFAIVESDLRRSQALHIEGLNTLRRSYGLATASVSEYMAAIDRASDSTNVGRDVLEDYTRSLSRAGLRGDALTQAVEAMGMAAMVQGERGANRFRALAMQTRLAGGSVVELAEQYRNRLGPIAQRMMLALPNQTDRWRRSLARVFSGLNTDRLLGALDQVLSLFSQSTASGRALTAMVNGILQPLLDDLAVVGPIARRFFQGMVIGALVLTIAILSVRNALRDTFGFSSLGGIDGLTMGLAAGVIVFSLLAAAAGAAALMFGVLALAIGAVVVGLLIIPAMLLTLGIVIGRALAHAVQWFRATDFRALGAGMIDGLLLGMRERRDAMVSAVQGLASDATTAFREAMGIHSPSRVFAELGGHITSGLTEGITAGEGGVNDAVSSLVEVPTASGRGAGGSGSVVLNFGDIVINGGGENARENALSFRDELASLLEGVSISMGAS